MPPPTATGQRSAGPLGRRGRAGRLLSPAGISLEEASRHRVTLDFADRSEAVEFLVRTAGHVLAERASLETAGRRDELLSALAALVAERDEGAGDRVSLRLEYLLALGTVDP